MDQILTTCSMYDTYNLTDIAVAEKWLWSEADYLISTVIIPVLCFIGVFGNGSFIFTILRLPKMKSSLNVYLFNLAVCDILLLLIAAYWYIANYLHGPVSHRTTAVESRWGCAAFVLSTHPWYFIGVELNTIITVERYLYSYMCASASSRHGWIKTYY